VFGFVECQDLHFQEGDVAEAVGLSVEQFDLGAAALNAG